MCIRDRIMSVYEWWKCPRPAFSCREYTVSTSHTISHMSTLSVYKINYWHSFCGRVLWWWISILNMGITRIENTCFNRYNTVLQKKKSGLSQKRGQSILVVLGSQNKNPLTDFLDQFVSRDIPVWSLEFQQFWQFCYYLFHSLKNKWKNLKLISLIDAT